MRTSLRSSTLRSRNCWPGCTPWTPKAASCAAPRTRMSRSRPWNKHRRPDRLKPTVRWSDRAPPHWPRKTKTRTAAARRVLRTALPGPAGTGRESDRHIGDFLVGFHQTVPHLYGRLKSKAGLLQVDHHIAEGNIRIAHLEGLGLGIGGILRMGHAFQGTGQLGRESPAFGRRCGLCRQALGLARNGAHLGEQVFYVGESLGSQHGGQLWKISGNTHRTDHTARPIRYYTARFATASPAIAVIRTGSSPVCPADVQTGRIILTKPQKRGFSGLA